MDEARFEEIRREHVEVLHALVALEEAVSRDRSGDPSGGRGALAPAVGDFLDFHARVVEPHMRAEEQDIYPSLDRYLSADVESADAILGEHETVRGLVALLGSELERVKQGAPGAESELAACAQDLALLLRDHIRKEDSVVNPLLRRLMTAGQRD